MNWEPAIHRLNKVVVGVLSAKVINHDRVRQWRQMDELPPILVTESGWLVDGNHRLVVARGRGQQIWAQIVENRAGDWIATGNIVRVK